MSSLDVYFDHFARQRRGLAQVQEKAFAPTRLEFEGNQPSVLYEAHGGIPYRGQEGVKRRLNMMVNTLHDDERIKVLLTGGAGSGKTALAWIVAKMIQDRHAKIGKVPGEFYEILPSQINTKADLDLLMHQLRDNDIIFIDEVHILKKNVGAEPLYHTLDDTGKPRYPLGDGKGWLDVPKSVSWIAATTEPGELDDTTGGALRRRLSPELRLDPPGDDVLAEILLDQYFPIENEAAEIIAARSGGLPWQALMLYKVAVQVAKFSGSKGITVALAEEALETAGVDEYGLTSEDRNVIFTLFESPYRTVGGVIRYKMSESALCAATGIDKNTYKQIIQPKLMRQGLLTTVGGQTLTEKAIRLLKNG